MRKNITLGLSFLLLGFLPSLKVEAQSACSCWQPYDTSFHVVPFVGFTPPYYRNDDGSSPPIALPFTFCFWGQHFNSVYINNNGNVTFGAGVGTFTSDTMPYNNGYEMIAPFWCDIDTDPGNPGFSTSDAVYYKMTPTHMIVQWDSVGFVGPLWCQQASPYGDYDTTCTFQLIISNGSDPIIPHGNNVEFCYKSMQFTTGADSPGPCAGGGHGFAADPAAVGANFGNGVWGEQVGLFDSPNYIYHGQFPASSNSSYDGVYWLDNREFFMNVCDGNAPPFEMSGTTPCDTFKICEGDTVKTSFTFYSFIKASNVHSVLANPVLSGTSIIYGDSAARLLPNQGPLDSVVVQVIGNASSIGSHTIGLWAYDNIAPADSFYISFVVEVGVPPVYTITAVQDTICLGNSSVLTAGGGLTYSWSPGGATTSSITVTPAATQTYSVSIKDAGCGNKDTSIQVVVRPAMVLAINPPNTGICAGYSLALTANGANSYTWTPTTGLSCSTCPNPSASPSVTTVYTITGTSNGCHETTTDTVYVYPLPVVSASASSDSICVGHSTNLSATGNANSYTWAPSTGLSCTNCANPVASPTVSTVYTVIGSSAHSCTNAATISIHIAPTPTVSVGPNKSVCSGQSITLIATGNSSDFTWQPGNIQGPSLTISPTSTETWTVTLTSAGCGLATAPITVFVNPQPVPQFSADITQGCSPLCIQFRDLSTLSSGKINHWNWKFGNGDTLNIENPIYCYSSSGVYSVALTATSDSGCSATLKTLNMITVYSHPIANFTATPQPTTILEPTLHFTDKSTDTYGISGWFWTFGDGDSINTMQNPTHTYRDTGTYCAKLAVMNMYGCTDTMTACLVIRPIFALYIPDAFSPNGDGKNEIFMAKGNDIKTFEMYIFDRWGMQLFHSIDINTGWNGRVNGGNTVCQEDIYVYQITVTDSKGTRHSYTGQVNLLK